MSVGASVIGNRACDLGPSRFPWWLDWRGRTVALVASGPSARRADAEKLKGRMPVFAVKQGVDLCPWADVVYGCDGHWWRYRLGLPQFKGLKLRWADNNCPDYPDVHGFTIKDNTLDRLLLDEPGVIGSGRNSGFQALNIALQFGARRILLVGFDMAGEHFYGRNNWAMARNPDEYNFQKWRAAFSLAARDLQQMGIEVVNVSTQSALKCFPKMPLDRALQSWAEAA